MINWRQTKRPGGSFLKIIVCVKQVPGTTQVDLDPETGVMKRDGASAKLNPYDLFAIETALELAAATGGSVRALTMGPPQAREALLETVWMGADSGVLVSDRRLGGADVLATARTLAQAVARMGEYDLILCGKQTTDGDTAQVGAELAEFLDLPHAGNVRCVTPGEGWVDARVSLDDRDELQRLPLPCLLCMDKDVNTPRLPSYFRKKALEADPVTVLSLDDFADRDPGHFGLSGSPTQVERTFPPERSARRVMLDGGDLAAAAQLARLLRDKKFVQEG